MQHALLKRRALFPPGCHMVKPARKLARLTRRPTHHALRPTRAQRESVAICDLSDCLLQAYEYVERRAYEIFVERGGEPGRELEDWLSAERELLLPITVDIEESADYVRALATAPGFTGSQIGVGIERRWLAIIAYRDSPPEAPPLQVFSVHQLPADVDPARVTIAFAEGLLGIRVAKISKSA
jgi:HSP20 family molecular chaperone IbpA